jgi:hypothetical protein
MNSHHHPLLLVAAALVAILSIAQTSEAAPTKQYVLHRHGKEHCKANYVRKIEHVDERVHGRKTRVRETVCVRVAESKPKDTPAPIAPTVPAPTSPSESPIVKEIREIHEREHKALEQFNEVSTHIQDKQKERNEISIVGDENATTKAEVSELEYEIDYPREPIPEEIVKNLEKAKSKLEEDRATVVRLEKEIEEDKGQLPPLCSEAGGKSEYVLNPVRGEVEKACVLESGSRYSEE